MDSSSATEKPEPLCVWTRVCCKCRDDDQRQKWKVWRNHWPVPDSIITSPNSLVFGQQSVDKQCCRRADSKCLQAKNFETLVCAHWFIAANEIAIKKPSIKGPWQLGMPGKTGRLTSLLMAPLILSVYQQWKRWSAGDYLNHKKH